MLNSDATVHVACCRWSESTVNSVLEDFDVVLFSDNDVFDKWTERAASLNKQGLTVRVSDLLKRKRPDESKCDLADVFLPSGSPTDWNEPATAKEIAVMSERMKTWTPTEIPINHDAEMITEYEILSWNIK